ncbi:MAG: hypothetical protein U5R31_01160 [Acidimicrobiia bacterium]|nr:hypothetical protein [Acidimicrobiia bacterium]
MGTYPRANPARSSAAGPTSARATPTPSSPRPTSTTRAGTRPGDIGVVDEGGWLRITDRKKDIIIRGGENISAAEVEGLLLQLKTIAECAVVAAPDPRYGERACAFVRVSHGVETPEPSSFRTTSTPRVSPARSGPRTSGWSTTSRGRPRARSASTSCERVYREE